jgi:hypothetical protein
MTSSGDDWGSKVVRLGNDQSDPTTLFLFALLLLNRGGVRMNSGEHSTTSAPIVCVRSFFGLGKTFLADQNQAMISHKDSNDSQTSILISSEEYIVIPTN